MKGVTPQLSDWCFLAPSKNATNSTKVSPTQKAPAFLWIPQILVPSSFSPTLPYVFWFYVGLRSLCLDCLSFLSIMKRNRRSFVKHFPKLSTIPSTFMDAHPTDDLPRQHRVTTEFMELLGFKWHRSHLIQTTFLAQTPLVMRNSLPFWVTHSCFWAALTVRKLVNSPLLLALPQRLVKRSEK